MKTHELKHTSTVLGPSMLLENDPLLDALATGQEAQAGKRASVLMCAPTAYALKYEINPWMKLENSPDLQLAAQQWDNLYHVLRDQVGAHVELVPQAPDCPDMVFTANAGIVREGIVALSSFHHPERQGEEPHFRRWFHESGFSIGYHFGHTGDSRSECRGAAGHPLDLCLPEQFGHFRFVTIKIAIDAG